MSFMTPLWWIRAFEIAQRARSFTKDPFSMTSESGLSPALTDTELNALLVVIQLTQEQVLSGSEWVTFDVENVQKHNPDRSRLKSFLFQRVLQLLLSLRIEPLAQTRSHGEASEPCALFDREARRQVKSGIWQTAYRLSLLAPELILGYAEPYSELQRLIEGKARIHRYLGQHAPLPLRPSVWLDLLNFEQFVFLQLQKATFWDRSNFHWDAVFGNGFEVFFEGLELPSRKVKENNERRSIFHQKLRLLRRVGRKLSEHGLIRTVSDIEFLAVDEDADPLSILWFGRDIVQEEEAVAAHEIRCVQFFRDHRIKQSIEALIPVLAPQELGGSESAYKLWQVVQDFTNKDKSGYLRIEGNLLLPLPALYFEWKLRKDAVQSLSLPAWVRESEAFRILAQTSSEENFLRFKSIIEGQKDYRRDIERIPRSSIAAPTSLRQREMLEFLASQSTGPADLRTGSAVEAGSLSSNSPTAPNRSSPPAPQPNEAAAIPVGKKGYNDIEVKRQVVLELQKMREKEPDRYALLKQQYLANLEREKKDIVFEMRERMQPQAFDDHLKNSLVKFMIDHPRIWQSEGTRFAP